MTASTTNYSLLDEKEYYTVSITNPLKSEFISKVQKTPEEEYMAENKRVLSLTSMSIKMLSTSYYKSNTFLEASDIEQIKDSLRNYTRCSDKVNDFKNELIDDLTTFQQQIKTNHFKKLADMAKEKQFLEKQVNVLNFSKHKLIMDRLSKVEWPYDNKTKDYDNKIATLQIKIQKYGQKIEDLQKMRPMATEKDILIYQMHLKEKYSV